MDMASQVGLEEKQRLRLLFGAQQNKEVIQQDVIWLVILSIGIEYLEDNIFNSNDLFFREVDDKDLLVQ